MGAAGAVMYGIQAALALANFALNVSRINSAQAFATGGKVKPIANGRINTAPNIATQPNGDNILATVRTGEVVLNEEQQRKLGGASTFRSIGVPGFNGGGAVIGPWSRPGMYGDNLLPPIDPASFLLPNRNNSSAVSADMSELKKMVADVTTSVSNVTSHVQTLRVINVATETTAVSDKHKKASNLGTL
jgi:hypothetical protein